MSLAACVPAADKATTDTLAPLALPPITGSSLVASDMSTTVPAISDPGSAVTVALAAIATTAPAQTSATPATSDSASTTTAPPNSTPSTYTVVATALGATPMSRPEDVEVNPITKKVYAVMTGNRSGTVNAANPRARTNSIEGQALGHVIEITEANGDNASLTFAWEVFLLCGQPNQTGKVAVNSSPSAALSTSVDNSITYWAGYDESKVSPVARVDNVSFDSRGNMFLSTDGQPSALAGADPTDPDKFVGWNDCLIGFPTEGAERGHGKTLMTAVNGCEVTGPFFTPDDKSLFVAIQHPGVDVFSWTSLTTPPVSSDGTFAHPGSTWNTTPAISGKTPGVPRSAALVIRRINGKEIAYGKPEASEPEIVSATQGASLSNPVAGSLAVLGGLLAFRYRRLQPEID